MRKYWLAVALTAVALIGMGVYFGLRGPMKFAQMGSVYAAKQTCSCMFVSGRTLASCQADLPGAAGNILKISVSGHDVEANAYGLVHARATFEEGYGCRIAS